MIGTVLLIELLMNAVALFSGEGAVPGEVSGLCLFLLALNPLSSYLGFYGNITGDNGLIMFYCSHFGFDASGRWFNLCFYKCSGLLCILTGLLFLFFAVRSMNKNSRKTETHP